MPETQAIDESILLQVENLKTYIYDPGHKGFFRIVDDVSFRVPRGKTVAVVGESGSGKTRLIYSIMGLIDASPGIVGGHIYLQFDGQTVDLLEGLDQVCEVSEQNGRLSISKDERRWRRHCGYEARMQKVRGRRIGLMLQEAKSALSPYQNVYAQIREAYVIGHGTTEGADETVRMLLRELHISEKASEYPHNLSGGTCHRAMMALSFAADPDLLIADEPTTGLDCPLQVKIVEMLDRYRRGELIPTKTEKQRSLLLVSHQLEVVEKLADEIVIMYGGKIMENGPAEVLLRGEGRHPYTRKIVDIYRNPPDLEAVQTPRLIQEATEKEFMLNKAEMVIGRMSSEGEIPDITVSDSLVSRRHAVITEDKQGFHIRNLGRNGTMVNGKPIETTFLKPGDTIQTGKTVFRYVLKAGDEQPLVSIPGAVSSPLAPPLGCRFEERCEDRLDICSSKEPREIALEEDRSRCVSCHIYDEWARMDGQTVIMQKDIAGESGG